MENLYQEVLPCMEMSSIRLYVVTNKLFEKLRPFFKNPEEGEPSLLMTDMNNITSRINTNVKLFYTGIRDSFKSGRDTRKTERQKEVATADDNHTKRIRND